MACGGRFPGFYLPYGGSDPPAAAQTPRRLNATGFYMASIISACRRCAHDSYARMRYIASSLKVRKPESGELELRGVSLQKAQKNRDTIIQTSSYHACFRVFAGQGGTSPANERCSAVEISCRVARGDRGSSVVTTF